MPFCININALTAVEGGASHLFKIVAHSGASVKDWNWPADWGTFNGGRAGLMIAPCAATYLQALGPVVIYRNAPNRKHPAFIGSPAGFIGCQ